MTNEEKPEQSVQRVVVLSRELVPHELPVTKVVWWWLAGWERKMWKHVDTCARTPEWLMPSKYRLNRLLAQMCKSRIRQVRRRQAVARAEERKDNDPSSATAGRKP